MIYIYVIEGTSREDSCKFVRKVAKTIGISLYVLDNGDLFWNRENDDCLADYGDDIESVKRALLAAAWKGKFEECIARIEIG